MAGESHGNHDSLPDTPAHLVGILLDTALGGRDTDRLERVDGPRHCLFLTDVLVKDDRLGDLVADGEDRVQARHRLLEDHRDVRAAHTAQLLRPKSQQITPVEPDLAVDDLAGRDIQQLHDRQRRDALAAARLTDDPQSLATLQGEVDAVNGSDCPVHHVEVGSEAPHVEQDVRVRRRTGEASPVLGGVRLLLHILALGSSASWRPSPMKLMPSTMRTMATPGKTAHHQLPDPIACCAPLRILPRVGVAGSMP